MSSQTNLQHLNDFIRISEQHKITLEFDSPEILKTALDEYRNSILDYEIQKRFKESTFMILYELDLEKRKTVSCGAVISPAYVHFTPYSPYVDRHLKVIRFLFDRYPVLDIDAGFMIMWSGKEPHVFENTEGFGYVIPSYVPIGAPPVTITDEEVLSFYEKALLSPTQKKFLMDQFDIVGPYYAEFGMDSTTPNKYGFHAHIREDVIEKHYQPWADYKNMHGVFDMINAAFMGSLISVQMSTDNRDFFGFEFGIPIDHAAGFIDRLIEFKCVDDDILKTLNSIIFPEFLDNIVFKLRWENKDTQNVKVYLETQSREFIETSF
jgi:hypothetical protein